MNTPPTNGLIQALYDGVDFDILPTQLERADVDLELWSAILQINQSGWAWTRFCCAGHVAPDPYEWESTPYIQIIVHRDDLPRMMELSQQCVDRAHTGQKGFEVIIIWTPASPNWWAMTLHYLDSGTQAPKDEDAERGRTMLFDLAENINPSRHLRLIT